MLPPDWKKEIRCAIDKADARSAERHEAQIAGQNAVTAPLNRLADEFVSYKSETGEREEGKRRREIATIIGLFANAFLVLVTALIFAGQLYEAHKAYDPIVQSANAAARSADIAERTLRISQSPILTFLNWKSTIEVGAIPEFHVQIVNVGHTIATLIDNSTSMTFQVAKLDAPVYKPNPVKILIPPNGGHNMDSNYTEPLSQAQFDALTNRRAQLLIWGRFTFENVFNEIWDWGYLVQFVPSKDKSGQWIWTDTYPTIPGYTFLTKRPDKQKKDQ